MTNITNPYRVVVAEDEPLILENIVQKIEGLDFPFLIVGTAPNGEDALELIKKHRPHILFTDIRMPLMDGLALIEQASKTAPDMQIVIISGYDDFEYARKALHFGVSDYLLKPVKMSALTETAEKLYKSLSRAASIHEREIITGSLHGQPPSSGLPSAFSKQDFHMHLICVGNLYDHCSGNPDSVSIHDLWQRMNVPDIAAEFAEPAAHWWLTDEKALNCKMLITTCPLEASGAVLHTRLMRSASPNIPVTVCSTQAPSAFTDIWKNAQTLRSCLRDSLIPCTSSHIIYTGRQSIEEPGAELMEKMTLAVFCCKRGQTATAMQNLSLFFDACQESGLSQSSLENYLASIAAQLEEEPGSVPKDRSGGNLKQKLFGIVAAGRDSAAMYHELAEAIVNYVTCFCAPEDSSKELFLGIHKYIDEHYLEPITIQTISDMFHFSPSYISRIFRRYNEQPPIRYLTKLRIAEAKRLITAHDDLSFAAIAEMTGYPDPHYFSRIFKNTTGYSPSEYKEKNCTKD